MSLSPDGSKLFVVAGSDSSVMVINTITNTVSDTIEVGHYPGAFGNFISTYTPGTGIGSQSYVKEKITIFPNPANDFLTIKISLMPNEIASLKISDITGKEMFSLKEVPSTSKIQTSDFSDGIYFCQIKTKREIITQKFIVQHQ
jgi:YVTN family beta-propeller protein